MALTVIKTADDIVFSGNPVPVIIGTNTDDSIGIEIHLRIYDDTGIVIGHAASHVIAGLATFDISNYLQTAETFNFDIFRFQGNDIRETSLSKQFSIEMYEMRKFGTEEFYNQILEPFWVVQGGFSEAYIANEGKSLLQYAGEFLTRQPEKIINREEYDILYFFSASDGIVKSKIEVFFNDGSTSTLYSGEYQIVSMKIYEVNSSFFGNSLSSVETAGKQIEKYYFSVADSNNVSISAKRCYKITSTPVNQKHFFFRNSFGCFDVMSFRGNSDISYEISRMVDVFFRNERTLSSSFREIRKANTGWLASSYAVPAKAFDYTAEILLSAEIYELAGFWALPVIPVTTDRKPSESGNFNYSFGFEYKFAFSDRLYSFFDENIALPGDFNSDFSNDFFI